MMYPRLRLLRDFISADGVFLASIDDFELHHFLVILDEIFGRRNRVATLIWDKTRKNDAKLFSIGHEYLVVYAKSLSTIRSAGTLWREPKPGADEILRFWRSRREQGENDSEIQAALRTWYRDLPAGASAKKLSRYKWVDAGGPWRDRDISWPGGGGPRYDVIHPTTGFPCKVPDAGWRFASPESMQEQIDQGLVQFRADHTEPPFRKAYLANDDADEDSSLSVMPSLIQKQAQVAIRTLRDLFDGEDVFENPKDHEVIARLIKYVTRPGSLILDSFGGSGTTGHSVFDLNRELEETRRFILVELNPGIAASVTAARLKRVIERTGSGGFRYCTLGKPLFDEWGSVTEGVTYSDLAAFTFFSETGSPIPQKASDANSRLGVFEGRAVHLLWSAESAGAADARTGNVLTLETLDALAPHPDPNGGPRVVYAEGCTVSPERLAAANVVFKQVPYQLGAA